MQMALLLLLTLALSTSSQVVQIPASGTPPTPRQGSTMLSISDKLYILGGFDSPNNYFEDIWSFDLNTATWQQHQAINSGPGGFHSSLGFSSDSDIYLYGGFSYSGPLSSLWKFSLSNSRWELQEPSGTSPPVLVLPAGCKFTNDNIEYFAVFGGSLQDELSDGLYLLDLSTWTWQDVINSDTKWAQGTLQYLDGKLYAYGGVTEGKSSFSKVIIYDIQDNSWSTADASGFKGKTLFGGAAYDNTLFAFPGWDQSSSGVIATTQALKADETQWAASDVEEIELVNYASTQSSKYVYVFGGRSESAIRNKLFRVQLDDYSVKSLMDDFDNPGNLMYSSMVVIGQNLVVFGGERGGKKNNDLWVFSMERIGWELVSTVGNVPAPRSHAGVAAQGDVVVVWGGMGEYEMLNDLFLFNFKTKRWIMIDPESTLMPNQRYGPCVSIDLPLIYIFGGKSIDGISPKLWQYNLEDNTYTILESSTKFEPGFGQYCEIVKQDDKTELFLAYGTGSIDHPIGYINSYDLSEAKWKNLFETENFKYNRSDAIVKRLSNYLFVIGGQTWHRDSYKDIQLIRYNSNSLETLSYSTASSIFASAYTYSGDIIYSYGGGSVYGDTVLNFQSSSSFFKISPKELCSKCKIPCSPGTYTLTNGTCVPCQKGTYNSKYDANNCLECPAGTENNIVGASSESQCYPCQEGYYASDTGTAQCYKCLESYSCPVGSKSVYLSNITDSITSDQPGMLKRNTAEANRIGASIQIAVILLGVTILVVLLFTEKTRKIIITIDMYNALHNYELDVPMYRRKTFFGSVFSMIFIILALILVIQTLILYFMDNMTETKRLIPLVILEDTVDSYQADLTVNVTFYNYGGECVDENDECVSDLEVTMNLIQSESYSHSCKKYQNNCVITLYCYTCEVSVESTILFAMREEFSYSTAIGVNFSSDSSIPDKVSKTSTVKAAESGTMFRGPTPTVFYFSLIPSLFEDDSSQKTGYHVITQSTPDAGTMIAPEEFSYISNQYVLLTVSRDLNTLYTLRLITYTLFLLIMALIGSVVGILNLIGGAMSFVESNYLQRKAKKEKDDKNEKLMDNRKLALKNLTTDEDYTKEKV